MPGLNNTMRLQKQNYKLNNVIGMADQHRKLSIKMRIKRNKKKKMNSNKKK